jgi:thiamine-phosphate pyrophosphorylase
VRGFYGVVEDAELARRLIDAGACAIQVRMKRASTRELMAVARAVREVTAGRVPFFVNDRLDVALAVGADGVHLGQDDLPLEAARRVAGGRLMIGFSTHNLAQALAAATGGADYLGFGPVYATSTKEHPDPVQGVAALAEITRAVAPLPVVAIGGVTPARARELAAAGAAAACAISSVNGAGDVEAAAREIASAF